jgi:LysR family hydrogen peroxide-inducible transcriptional activator
MCTPRTNSPDRAHMVASGWHFGAPGDALTPKYHSRMVVPVPFAARAHRRVALAYRRSFPRPAAIAAIREAVAVCRPAKATPIKTALRS